MPQFRKKPVVIQAVQWDGDNTDEVLTFGEGGPAPAWGDDFKVDITTKEVFIHTSEGQMRAGAGDWIIRGVKGEYYPCKPDIFEATYEPVFGDEPSCVHGYSRGSCSIGACPHHPVHSSGAVT